MLREANLAQGKVEYCISSTTSALFANGVLIGMYKGFFHWSTYLDLVENCCPFDPKMKKQAFYVRHMHIN